MIAAHPPRNAIWHALLADASALSKDGRDGGQMAGQNREQPKL